MPVWLYRSDKTDRIFFDELWRTIKESGRYKPMRITIPTLSLSNASEAEAFRDKHDLALIIHHDSPFYSTSKKYMRNVLLLQEHVPLLNTHISHQIGHSKINTKRLLRERDVPVLDDAVIYSVEALNTHLQEGSWYVIKPADKGAGTGVKLIKKENGALSQYRNGEWWPVTAISKKENTVTIKRGFGILSSFTYAPMLVEPYFNDDIEGFASLRCTVVGNEIVEVVKRTNRSNITSNVSSGGTAIKTELNDEQKEMVLAAAKAIGIDYAGIDLLVCGGKSVIGEVNIGPFTVFSAYTGAPVGKKLAEYAMKKSDEVVC
jgi:glutathione synthase/RimK-type ligase-like ATP-grasp enzyme